MELTDFYLGLKPFDAVSDFYVKGYTETLRLFKDSVKIVTPSDFSGVPYKFRKYFFSWNDAERGWEVGDRISFPCYFIPISKGRECFGFILKGKEKSNVRFSTWISCFNFNALFGKESYIIGVEGIKDCYPFLKRGHPAIGVLGPRPHRELLDLIKSTGKKFIYISDNDSEHKKVDTGRQMREKLKKDMTFLKMRYVLPELPSNLGDCGEYFDSEEKRVAVEKFVDLVEGYI